MREQVDLAAVVKYERKMSRRETDGQADTCIHALTYIKYQNIFPSRSKLAIHPGRRYVLIDDAPYNLLALARNSLWRSRSPLLNIGERREKKFQLLNLGPPSPRTNPFPPEGIGPVRHQTRTSSYGFLRNVRRVLKGASSRSVSFVPPPSFAFPSRT